MQLEAKAPPGEAGRGYSYLLEILMQIEALRKAYQEARVSPTGPIDKQEVVQRLGTLLLAIKKILNSENDHG